MNVLLALLAAAGVAALLFRLLRALLAFGRTAAEATALAGLSEISARRGDLATLAERREAEQTFRRQRRRAASFALVWIVLLLVPPFTPWARTLYAAAALLWAGPLLPKRVRRSVQKCV